MGLIFIKTQIVYVDMTIYLNLRGKISRSKTKVTPIAKVEKWPKIDTKMAARGTLWFLYLPKSNQFAGL
jgi:hypothetical protein